MQFEDYEYYISEECIKSITLTKAALEKWRDHYTKAVGEIPKDHKLRKFMVGYYFGKRDALVEILKHFEEEEED